MASSHSTPNTSSTSSPSPYQHPQHPQNPANQSGMNPSNSGSGSGSGSSSSRPQAGTPRSMRGGKGSTSRNEPPPFTASMQDAQARNKDPYESSDESSDEGGWSGRWDAYGNDSYENVQKRRMAAVILDSPELLLMHAQARCDSLAGTRYYFTKLLCGYHDEDDTYPIDGQVADKDKEKTKEKEKAKRQVSGQSSKR